MSVNRKPIGRDWSAERTVQFIRELKTHISYNPDTGVFLRIDGRTGPKQQHPNIAGTVKVSCEVQYRQISVNCRLYRACRLAWLLTHNRWPTGEIDHEDGDGLNDAIRNLRDVPHKVNSKNMKRHLRNVSGVTGVTWNKKNSKWQARVCVDGQETWLGLFSTVREAATARKNAERGQLFHVNHGQERPRF